MLFEKVRALCSALESGEFDYVLYVAVRGDKSHVTGYAHSPEVVADYIELEAACVLLKDDIRQMETH